MEFSSRAWHIRLIRFLQADSEKPYIPSSLCLHFWRVVFTLTIQGPIMLILFIVIMTPFGVGFGCYEAFKWISRRWRRQASISHQKTLRPKEPNLIIEWFKAKKSKVCPVITVREE